MDAYDLFLQRKKDVKFYDGDTAYGVEGDSEDRSSANGLRLEGINTPEVGMAGSDAALEMAREYETDSRTVFGDGNVFSEKGYYGRRLGDRVNESTGKRLSHELLKQGLATPGNSATDQQTALYDSFLAKNNGLGMNAPTQEERDAYDRFQINQAAQVHDLRSRDNPYQGAQNDFHGDALERGKDQVQQMGFGFAKLIGEAVGSEDMEDWAQRGIDVNTLEMFLNPRQTRSFTESQGFGNSVASLYESVIEQAPNIGVTLAASIASGGVGGLVGRSVASSIAAGETAAATATQQLFKNAIQNTVWSGAGKQALNRKVRKELGFGKTGMQVGAGTASVGMNTGETKITFDREGIDNNGLAAFVGGVKGALDFAGLSNIPGVNRLIGMGVRGSAGKVTRAELFKKVPFQVMKAGVVEGSTEAMQQVADIVAVNNQKNRGWSEADTNSVIEALAVGAFVGKAFAIPGATGQAAFTQIEQDIDNSDLPPEKKEAAKAQAEVLLLEWDGVIKLPNENVAEPVSPTPAQEPTPQPDTSRSFEESAEAVMEASSVVGRHLGSAKAKQSPEGLKEVAYNAKKDAYSTKGSLENIEAVEALIGNDANTAIEFPSIIESRKPRFMTSGGYSLQDNEIHITKDNSEFSKNEDGVTPARTIHHEVGHWGFMNALTGEERVEAAKLLQQEMSDDLIPGKEGHDYPKGKFRDMDEFVAEMYSQHKRGMSTDSRLLPYFKRIDASINKEQRQHIDAFIRKIEERIGKADVSQGDLQNQPIPESKAQTKAQKAEVAKGRKKGQFSPDPSVPKGYSSRGKIAKVNDGKEAGVATFDTARKAMDYAKEAKVNGVESANHKFIIPDGAPTKSEINPETAEAVQVEVGGQVVDEAATTPETTAKVAKKLKKQYPDGKVTKTNPSTVIKDRLTSPPKFVKGQEAIDALNALLQLEAEGHSTQASVGRWAMAIDRSLKGAITRLSRIPKKQKERRDSASLEVRKLEAAKRRMKGVQESVTKEKPGKEPITQEEYAGISGDELAAVSDATGSFKDQQEIIDKAEQERQESLVGQREPSKKEMEEESLTFREPIDDEGTLEIADEGQKLSARTGTEAMEGVNTARTTKAESLADQQERESKDKAALIGKEKEKKKQRKNRKKADKILKEDIRGKAKKGPQLNKTRMRSVKKFFNKTLAGKNKTITQEQLFKVFDQLPPQLARMYKALFANARILGVELMSMKGSQLKGSFNAATGTVKLSYDPEQTNILGGEMLLHELLHSVSQFHGTLADAALATNTTVAQMVKNVKEGKTDGLTPRQVAQVKAISETKGAEKTIALAQSIKETFDQFHAELKKDGITDPLKEFNARDHHLDTPREFIAVALSNENVMSYLNEKKSTREKSLFGKILAAFSKYFGIKEGTLLEDLLYDVAETSKDTSKINEEIMNPVPEDVNFTARQSMPLNRVTRGMRTFWEKEGIRNMTQRAKDILLGAITPFRSTWKRLNAVSPRLARLYKQVRGGVEGKLGYKDIFDGEASFWKAAFDKAFIKQFTPAEQTKAYEEYIKGNVTSPAAKVLQKYFNDFAKYLESSPVKHVKEIGKRVTKDGVPYFPQIHDAGNIRENREAFVKFLLTGNKGKPFGYTNKSGKPGQIDAATAESIVDGLLTQSDLQGNLHPQAASMQRRVLTDPAYQGAAMEAGWLNKDPRSVVEFYVQSMTRQKAFEETFGERAKTGKAEIANILNSRFGYGINKNDTKQVKKALQNAIDRGLVWWEGDIDNYKGDFEFWAPAAKRDKILEGLSPDSEREAIKAMDAMDGMLGLDMKENTRNSMQWAVVAQSYMLLAFSTISSLPEFGVLMAGLMGKSPSAAWKGLQKFASDIGSMASEINKGKSIKQIENESLAMARILGTIPDALTATGFVDSKLFEVTGNKPRAAMEKLFTYNGNILFNNALRAIATNVGVDYFAEQAHLAHNKKDKAAKQRLERWGVEPKEFLQWIADGKPRTTKDGAPTKFSSILLNFVDAHVARPTSDTKAVFGNDPRFMLLSQLKSFFYAYGTVILPEIARTMAERYSTSRGADKAKVLAGLNAMLPAAVIGALALPLGFMAMEMKAAIKGLSDDDYEKRRERYRKSMSNMEKGFDLVRTSGVMGPIDLLWSFYDAKEFDKSPLAKALGPTAEHIETLLQYGPTSPEFVKRTTPLAGVVAPGLYYDWIQEAKAERRKAERERKEDK